MKELILLKVITTTNTWFAIVGFLIRDSNFKILYAMLVMIWHGFKYQDSVYNGYHDLTMLSVNIKNVAIITVKYVDYRWIICNTSKSEAIKFLKKICAWRLSVYIKNMC